MACRKMVNAAELSLTLNRLRIQRNTETNTTAAKSHETYTCATKNPQLGIFHISRLENKHTIKYV